MLSGDCGISTIPPGGIKSDADAGLREFLEFSTDFFFVVEDFKILDFGGRLGSISPAAASGVPVGAAPSGANTTEEDNVFSTCSLLGRVPDYAC